MNTKQLLLVSGFIFILLVLIKVFDISYPLTIISTTKTTEFAVVGEGKVDAVPDTLIVSAGIVVNNASSVQAAQTQINDANNKIISAMKNLGIKKEDIKTTNYSIVPTYNYNSGQQNITGYNGNATVTIKVRNFSLAPQVMDNAAKAGANQIEGTQFVIENPDKYRELARNAAIDNAKQQANKLAQTLGITLGKIDNIVEATPNQPGPLFNMRDASPQGLGAGAPILEPGSQTITSLVTLYFEKK